MTDIKIGARVTALRNTDPDQKIVYVYGDGVYEGEFVRPDAPDVIPEEDAEIIRAIFLQDDAVPLDEHRAVQFVAAARGNVEEVKAKIAEDRERPMEERVADMFRFSALNPCIHLDSGDTVWGYQCWWGETEQVSKKLEGFTFTIVPVPEGNPTWAEMEEQHAEETVG